MQYVLLNPRTNKYFGGWNQSEAPNKALANIRTKWTNKMKDARVFDDAFAAGNIIAELRKYLELKEYKPQG